MTWRETISKAAGFLEAKGVPDAPSAAEFLAARLLGTGRGFLAAAFESEPEERHIAAMRRGMARLVRGEPVQYVIGEWDFRSLTLKCDPRALIPRPETEQLVTRVLSWLRKTADGSRRLVLDVGTGTGAIALSIAAETGGDVTVLATDVSGPAVDLARENAERCGLSGKVRFAVMDGLDDFDEPGLASAIVSNPPYVETAVCETLDPRVKDHEPRIALDGGKTGLDFYERYLADALHVLKPGGAVFFEIGETQGAALRSMMQAYGFESVRVERDFAGNDRYASAELP